MASKMMQAKATTNRKVSMEIFMNTLERYYQIQDNYNDVPTLQASASSYELLSCWTPNMS
jgi:hypothetical protein